MSNFVSVAVSIAELARGEELHTHTVNQSINHSASLFDAPGTEAFASENVGNGNGSRKTKGC